MKVFLFEYATCGAFLELDPSITVEGLGMFKTLLGGFKEVTTFVDKRIPLEDYPTVDNYRERFSECIERADAALIIAPEPEMEYYHLVLELEKAGCANLGSSSEAVRDTTDKYETFRKLKGVRTPKTEIYNANTSIDFPLVAKPRDGVSCEGIILVRNDEDLKKVPKGYLLQEYIGGMACSASLLVGDEVRVISVNTQEINNFTYHGAKLPIALKDTEEIIKAVERIKGLFGYVGVDFIYDGEVHVIEINARPTTPIIAMKDAFGINISELILANYYNERIPEFGCNKKVHLRKGKGLPNPYVSFKDYDITLEDLNEDIHL